MTTGQTTVINSDSNQKQNVQDNDSKANIIIEQKGLSPQEIIVLTENASATARAEEKAKLYKDIDGLKGKLSTATKEHKDEIDKKIKEIEDLTEKSLVTEEDFNKNLIEVTKKLGTVSKDIEAERGLRIEAEKKSMRNELINEASKEDRKFISDMVFGENEEEIKNSIVKAEEAYKKVYADAENELKGKADNANTKLGLKNTANASTQNPNNLSNTAVSEELVSLRKELEKYNPRTVKTPEEKKKYYEIINKIKELTIKV